MLIAEFGVRNGGVAGYGVHVAGIAEFAQLNMRKIWWGRPQLNDA